MRYRRIILQLAVVTFAGCLGASSSYFPPKTAEQKMVWTNEDLIALRAIAPISETGPATEAEVPASAAGYPAEHYSHFKDPRWYREQLEPLRGELARTEARLNGLRSALKSGKGGTNGIDLFRDVQGVTPESEVELLVKHRADVLKQIDAIEDLAQRNGILPGELRKERSQEEISFSDYLKGAAAETPAAEAPKTEAEWRARFAELREKLEFAQRELDVLQREWSGGLVENYRDPNKLLRERLTRNEINVLAAKIRDKKTEIAQLKQAISDLEDDLRHAGGPAGWARE